MEGNGRNYFLEIAFCDNNFLNAAMCKFCLLASMSLACAEDVKRWVKYGHEVGVHLRSTFRANKCDSRCIHTTLQLRNRTLGVEAEGGINWTRVQEGMQLVTVQSPKVGQQEGNSKGIRVTYLNLFVLCGT